MSVATLSPCCAAGFNMSRVKDLASVPASIESLPEIPSHSELPGAETDGAQVSPVEVTSTLMC